MDGEDEKKKKEERMNIKEALLDSSLTSATDNDIYDTKVYDCNSCIQIYRGSKKIKKKPSKEGEVIRFKDYAIKTSSIGNSSRARQDNAYRSKLSLERLVKGNVSKFKTFITLTFAENILEIDRANKALHSWLTLIKKVYNDFSYICVPEFQKRGAVHYHLLTNIETNSHLITLQDGKESQYDVKYWNKGFTSVFPINDINKTSGYISKYISKTNDKRLFNKKRYLHSNNIEIPKILQLNMKNEEDINKLNILLEDKSLKYESNYTNPYNNEDILFLEFTSYNVYYVNFYLCQFI